MRSRARFKWVRENRVRPTKRDSVQTATTAKQQQQQQQSNGIEEEQRENDIEIASRNSDKDENAIEVISTENV
jgi:hypothetical protein